MFQVVRKLVVAVFLLAASAPSASACSVCMGNRDSALVKGAEGSVLLMILVTYVMLLGFVGVGVTWFVRARRIARLQSTDQDLNN